MRTTWTVAALALVVFPACKDRGVEGAQGQDQVKTEQKRAEDDFKRASDAQKKATDEQQQAKSAQADVEKARKDLQDKEQKAQKEASESQQAQSSATAEAQKAQTEGVQAQQRAQQGLQQQQAQQAQTQQPQQSASAGATEVSGKIARATSSEIQLENHPQPLKVDSSTQVTLDGKTVSVDQLPAGSEVRASFRMDSGEAKAIKIDATSK